MLTHGSPASHRFASSHLKARLQLLLSAQPTLATVRQLDLTSQLGLLTGHLVPVRGDEHKRARAAIDWLLQARASTRDGGFSEGLFAGDDGPQWRPSSLAATGLAAQTFAGYLQAFSDPTVQYSLVDTATHLAERAEGVAAELEAAMVLGGLTAAHRATSGGTSLSAAPRLAAFVARRVSSGASPGTTGHDDMDGTCAVMLARYGRHASDAHALDAARALADRVRARQLPNGWIGDAHEAPTEVLVQALAGLVEVAASHARADLVEAGVRTADLLIAASREGRVPCVLGQDGSATVPWSAVGVGAHLAAVLFRLFELSGAQRLLDAANGIVDFTNATQINDHVPLVARGAVPAGVPLLTIRASIGWPSSATCHFVDAALLQLRFGR